MTRDQIFRQTSVDLFFLSVTAEHFPTSWEENFPTKVLWYGPFFFVFWTVEQLHFWTRNNSSKTSQHIFSSGHFLLNRRTFPDERVFRQKSKCRFSDLSEPMNSTRDQISRQKSTLLSFFRSFFLLILNSWTANFPKNKNSDKSLNLVFLPTIYV